MLKPLTTQIVASYTKPHWLARHERFASHDGSWWRPEAVVLKEAREDAARPAIYEQERTSLDVVSPSRLHPSSDCGMWFLSRELAHAKISALATGTALVRAEL